MNESQILNSILNYLQIIENQSKGYFCRNNTIQSKIIRKDESIGYIKNGKKGSPDIIGHYKGNPVYFEVKTEKGKQSKHQKESEKRIIRSGGYYFIVRSVSDVISSLTFFDN